jgi:hypothetical protein
MNLNQFNTIQENTDTLLTIIVHNTSCENFLTEIEQKLVKAKDIKDMKKKKLINDRLFKLKTYLDSCQDTIINSIFLIGNCFEKIPIKPKFCTEWNLPKFQYFADYNFKIEYLVDIFENENLLNIVHVDKTNTHYIGTKYKKKNMGTVDSSIYLVWQNLNVPFITYGKITESKAILKLPNNTKWESIFDEYKKSETKKVLLKLQTVIKELSNPLKSGLYAFRAEIQDAIDQYLIKELYVSATEYKKLVINNPNFEVYIIESLEQGDSGHILQRDFDGVIGIKYYG